MRVSPHFTLREFLVSSVHPELAAQPFELTHQITIDICRLIFLVMQPIRDRFGPITITSGFRTPLLNTAVGGADNSLHLVGRACDFEVQRGAPDGVWRRLVAADIKLDYDRLAYYPTKNRFHIEVPSSNDDPRRLVYIADPNWREVTAAEVLS